MPTLERRDWLPLPRDEVFPFFADPLNLEVITPPWLAFRILTPPPLTMEAGRRIDYRLRLHGVPVRWQSEITRWSPPHGFVDEQRVGPYRSWVHVHEFEERAGGTVVLDRVDYEVPGGRLVDRIAVEPDLRRIFDFRRDALRKALLAQVA
jgi:ligand-binding SRPBCC domain-containing protein